MAIIIKCKNCRKRLKDDSTCPYCSAIERTYILDYYPEGRNGSRIRQPLPEVNCFEDAREIELLIRTAGKEEKEAKKSFKGEKVKDLYPEYLEWTELHRMPSTVEDLRNSSRNIEKIIGSFEINDITAQHLALFQKVRHKQGVSNRTVNKEMDYFGGFLRWCREEKEIPIPKIKIKKLPYSRPIPTVLSMEEVTRIIDASIPFYKAFFLCLYTLGLRLSEVRKLKKTNVDFENKSVIVIQKGGRYKILPLNEWLEKALKEIIDPDKGEYIFESPSIRSKGKPITDVKKGLARACKKAGITKHVTPHLFRHSIATHLLGEDVNLRTIQEYLGHRDIGTTEWYTHVVTLHLKTAADKVFNKIKMSVSTTDD